MKILRLIVLMVSIMMLVVACGNQAAPVSPAAEATAAPAPTEAGAPAEAVTPATDSNGGDKITLTYWMGGEPGTVDARTQLIDEYMKEHPNVEVKTTFMGSELVSPSILPALNAGTGPDIFGAGTGPGQPAAIINAGHALDLTPFYYEFGWNKVIPPTVVNYTSSNGKLWAVGDSVETTMMFYNKDIFEKNGLSVPTSWGEFLAVCDKLKAAKYETVIALGGADKWPISHWQSMLWGAYAGPKGIDKVMFSDGRWDDQQFVQATKTLEQLNEAGYFGPNSLAVKYDDVMPKFWRGEIPMTFTGSWVIGDAVRDLGDKIATFSVFPVPSPVEGSPIYPTEDIGSGWYINAKSPHTREAAELLNFLFFRDESRKMLLESGDDVPVGPLELDNVNLPKLQQELFAINNKNRGNGTIHAFLDTVQPANMTDVTYDGLQAILAKQMTPEQFTQQLQSSWEEAKGEDAILKPGGVAPQQ